MLTDKVWIYKAAGGSRAFNLGKVYVSYEKGPLGYIQPPNTFTAQIDPSGVITRQTPYNWLASCSGTSSKTCLFVSNFVANPMNCTATQSVGGSSGGKTLYAIQSNSTQVSFALAENNAAANLGASISCTKTGTDYAQPALTVQEMDFTGRVFTPNITYGSGAATNITWAGTISRNGSKATFNLIGTYSGASAAFNTPIFNLPTGYTMAVSRYPTGLVRGFPVGKSNLRDSGTATYSTGIVEYLSATTFGIYSPAVNIHTGTAGVFENAISNTFPVTVASGDTINAIIELEIAEWGAVTAPPLKGMVFSSDENGILMNEVIRFIQQGLS